MRIPKLKPLIKKQEIKSVKNGYFNSIWVSKFINKLMRNGKKSTIEKIVHPILINFKSQTPTENMEMFLITNLEQLKLPIEIRTRTRRGKSIAIPFPVKLKRQYVNVLTSIIAEIKNKKNFKNKLQYRILACFSTLNKSKENIEKNKFFKKKVELRDFIQENKTNKRFRWI